MMEKQVKRTRQNPPTNIDDDNLLRGALVESTSINYVNSEGFKVNKLDSTVEIALDLILQ